MDAPLCGPLVSHHQSTDTSNRDPRLRANGHGAVVFENPGGDQGSRLPIANTFHPRCYRMKEPGDRAFGAHILPAVVGQRSTAPGVRPDQRPDRDFGALHRFRSVPGTYGLTCRLYSTPGGPAVSLTLGQIVEVVKVAASA